MKKMFLFFSHKLNSEQEKNAKDTLKTDEFVRLPDELQKSFSNVPPELETLEEYVKPFWRYLKENAKKDDLVLIQGDFGLSFLIVEFCKKEGFIPVYATTKREVLVEKDGTKVSKFRHIRFRRY